MSQKSHNLLLESSGEPPKPPKPNGAATEGTPAPGASDEEERLRNWNLLGFTQPEFKPLSEMVTPLGRQMGSNVVERTSSGGEQTGSLPIPAVGGSAQSQSGLEKDAGGAGQQGGAQVPADRSLDAPRLATTDIQPLPQPLPQTFVEQQPPQGLQGLPQSVGERTDQGAPAPDKLLTAPQIAADAPRVVSDAPLVVPDVPRVIPDPQQTNLPTGSESRGLAAPAVDQPANVVQTATGERTELDIRPPADKITPIDKITPVDRITPANALESPTLSIPNLVPAERTNPFLPPKSKSDTIPVELSERTFSAGRSLSVDSKDMLTPWRVPTNKDGAFPPAAVKSELSPALTLNAVQPGRNLLEPVATNKLVAARDVTLKISEPVVPARLSLPTVTLNTKVGELRAPLLTDVRKLTGERAPSVVPTDIKVGALRNPLSLPGAITTGDRADRSKSVVIRQEPSVRVDTSKLIGTRAETRLDPRLTTLRTDRTDKTIPVVISSSKAIRIESTRVPSERLVVKSAPGAGDRPIVKPETQRADRAAVRPTVWSPDRLVAINTKTTTPRSERFVVKSATAGGDRPVAVIKANVLRADGVVTKPPATRADALVAKPPANRADRQPIVKPETLRADRLIVKPAAVKAETLRTDRLTIKPAAVKAEPLRTDRLTIKTVPVKAEPLRADRLIPTRESGRNLNVKADAVRALPLKADAVRAIKLDTTQRLQPLLNTKPERLMGRHDRSDALLTSRTFKPMQRIEGHENSQSRAFNAAFKSHLRTEASAHLNAVRPGSRQEGRVEPHRQQARRDDIRPLSLQRQEAPRYAVSTADTKAQNGIKFGEIRRTFTNKVLAREGEEKSLASSIEQRLLAARMDYLVQAIEQRSCAEDRYLTSLELLLGCLLTMAAVGKRSERAIAPRGQDIDAAMTLVLNESDDMLAERKTLRIQAEQASPDASQKVLQRPVHMMSRGDTLTGLAEQYFGDEKLGWLILELNAGKLRPQWNGDTCLTEATERLRIELPVSQDIQEFRAGSLTRYAGKSLLTYVRESGIDRELTLSNFKNSLSSGSKRGWRMTVMQAQST